MFFFKKLNYSWNYKFKSKLKPNANQMQTKCKPNGNQNTSTTKKNLKTQEIKTQTAKNYKLCINKFEILKKN